MILTEVMRQSGDSDCDVTRQSGVRAVAGGAAGSAAGQGGAQAVASSVVSGCGADVEQELRAAPTPVNSPG